MTSGYNYYLSPKNNLNIRPQLYINYQLDALIIIYS